MTGPDTLESSEGRAAPDRLRHAVIFESRYGNVDRLITEPEMKEAATAGGVQVCQLERHLRSRSSGRIGCNRPGLRHDWTRPCADLAA